MSIANEALSNLPSVAMVTKQSREEWLAERRTGVGGSDAAPAAGISKWTTPLQLYMNKKGEFEAEETPDMVRGTRLEPVVRQEYCDMTGYTVVTPGRIIRHPDYDWMLANLDGLAAPVGDPEIVAEFKTNRSGIGWGEPGTSDVPIDYLCQVQHYMKVTGLQRADIAVMFAGFNVEIYPVEADRELQDMLFEAAQKFWSFVQSNTPPASVDLADVALRYPKALEATVTATDEIVKGVRELIEIEHELKRLASVKDELQMRIKSFIAENSVLMLGNDRLATWRNSSGRSTIDTKRLRAEMPEVYAKYLKQGKTSRRFLLKGEAEHE